MKLSELFSGSQNQEWHGYDAPAGTLLFDGTVTTERDRLWRRRVTGQWQFKRMTNDEYAEELAERSI